MSIQETSSPFTSGYPVLGEASSVDHLSMEESSTSGAVESGVDIDDDPYENDPDILKARIKQRLKNLRKAKSSWPQIKSFIYEKIFHINRLDRYLIWKFLSTYFFVIVIIISIAMVFDITENIDKFVSRNATMRQIFLDYYVNFVPFYSNLFSQLFVFISVIYFTTKLAENSEIIAMMSTGVTFSRLLRPYIISSVLISLLTYYLGAYVIPEGNIKRVKFENTYKKRNIPTYTTNVQLEVDHGVIAYIGRYEDSNKTGYEFFLDKFRNKKLVSHLQSTTIRYDTLSEEPYHWILSSYSIRDLQGMREVLSSGSRLDTILKMEPQDFLITRGQQETLTTPKLSRYISRQKERGFANIKEFEFEYWKRGSSSFAIIILTIMGVSLSARKRKNGMGIALGIGIFLSLLYIMFQTVSKTFAVNLNMHPALAAWLPNIVFAFIAYILYKKAPR